MKNSIKLSIVTVLSAGLFTGCENPSSLNDTLDAEEANTGYFIDAAVSNVHYETTSGLNGKTDNQGRFRFKTGDKVKFSLGKLILGESEPQTDGLITPKHLIVGDNTSPNDEQAKAISLLLRTLQSLDSDDNTSNGITITQEVLDNLSTEIKDIYFKDVNESALIELDNRHDLGLDDDYDGLLDVDEAKAKSHFIASVDSWEKGEHEELNKNNDSGNGKGSGKGKGKGSGNGNGSGKGKGNGSGNGNGGKNHGNEDEKKKKLNLANYSKTENLPQELKNSLAYMGNEERLAYDVYMNLYDYYKNNNSLEIKQFVNIATKSESKHISMVQDIVKRYDLNATDFTNVDETIINDNNMSSTNMLRGVYDIEAIQNLYNTLYDLGKTDRESALKVGCMVEVTDINDLDKYIAQATEANATDIKATFEVLRDGSYNHYWAFDKGLKNIGVENGCYDKENELLTDKSEIYPKN